MTIQTRADIAGADAKVALSSTQGVKARRIWLTASGGTARFGDANVAVGRGVICPQNVLVTISASDADPTDTIDLTIASVYVPTGTTLTVSWGN